MYREHVIPETIGQATVGRSWTEYPEKETLSEVLHAWNQRSRVFHPHEVRSDAQTLPRWQQEADGGGVGRGNDAIDMLKLKTDSHASQNSINRHSVALSPLKAYSLGPLGSEVLSPPALGRESQLTFEAAVPPRGVEC